MNMKHRIRPTGNSAQSIANLFHGRRDSDDALCGGATTSKTFLRMPHSADLNDVAKGEMEVIIGEVDQGRLAAASVIDESWRRRYRALS